MPQQLFSPKTKENIFTTSNKKKNALYLLKRELGLPFDSTWRYIQGKVIPKNYVDHTVFQRRFHMDLRFIEFIDIVFRDNFTEKDLKIFAVIFDSPIPKILKISTITKKWIYVVEGGKLLKEKDNPIQYR